MGELKFIIALTEHRFLGNVFHPFLIQKSERFYSVLRIAKPRDFDDSDYHFKPYEKELVNIIEAYSDEALMKKFSRAGNVSEFYTTLRAINYEKKVLPYLQKCMMKVAHVLMLSPVELYKKDSKYSNLYDEDKIEVAPIFGRPEYHFTRTETETRYRLKIFLDKKEISLRGSTVQVLTSEPCLILYRNQLVAFQKLNAKKISPFFEKDFVVVPNTIEEKYYSGFVLNTVRNYEVKANGFLVQNVEVEKQAILSLEKNLQYEPNLILQFKYGNERFTADSKKEISVSLEKQNGTFVFNKSTRDFDWERKVLETLEQIGLKEANGSYTIPAVQLLKAKDAFYYFINWINKNKPQLTKYGIAVVLDKIEKSYFTGNQKLELQTQIKGDWFDVHANVRFGEFNIPFIKLKKYILNDIREFELPNGEIAVLPEEWFARYKGLLPFAKQKGELLQFEKHHFTLLSDSIHETDKEMLEKFKELTSDEIENVALPSNLNAQLRKYQEIGFNWMYGLYANGFGGCLADDMGLGKTIQTLTLLLKLKRSKHEIKVDNPLAAKNQLDLFDASSEEGNEIQPASLIVVPTSLVHNWDNEIQKFTPALKVFKFVGTQRKKVVDLSKIAKFYDVIITTYGTVRIDRDLLSKTEFHYIILDESQSIKNSTSKTYKAVMGLKGKHKLVITGTPIENSLSDLWSQMNFLNPGILGSLAFFRRSFITPIEKHVSEEQQEKLQLMIRPFILRRKKDEVAKDLPPLVEQVVFCSLLGEQKKMYEEEKSIIRNSILASIEDEGISKSGIVVLQGLTKLRQLANHPSMLKEGSSESSGKFDEIFRMLENLVAENHKVLIFSSFVSHLELIQNQVEKENWKFSKLTGQTTNRENVIKEFQEDAENRIFLISLKAGGVGLNLTEADYVFIVDPWWNPAAENQAINRAHRIGQEKHVFVYRFITENSIEEKIQQLKERKSSLADRFINSNNPLKKITKEEIMELFK